MCERVREILAARGARAMCGLLRMFKRLDINGDNKLCLEEFSDSMKVGPEDDASPRLRLPFKS